MSYNTAGSQKFTAIDDLPELDDLEQYSYPQKQTFENMTNSRQNPSMHLRGGPSAQDPGRQVNKFLRQRHSMPSQAGMVRNSHPQTNHQPRRYESENRPVVQERYKKPID